MSSGFVSGGTVEQPTERDDEWLQAQQEIEARDGSVRKQAGKKAAKPSTKYCKTTKVTIQVPSHPSTGSTGLCDLLTCQVDPAQ